MTKLDPSALPGTHRTRVFVGGSYAPTQRLLLEVLAQAVRDRGFEPIMADEYALVSRDHDVHDVTLWLLHSCRLAIFELSTLSGALMEIERCSDYGIAKALVLYQDPFKRPWRVVPDAWRTSAMVKSLVVENSSRFVVRPYGRPGNAAAEAKRFLRSVRSSSYGQLHNL